MDARADIEREESFLKLLNTLQVAGKHGTSGLGVVGRIAAWIDSPKVLAVICRSSLWFGDWQIKEALLRNPLTPSDFKAVLERQIAVFDLLRELDAPGLEAEEKKEIREDVRGLLATLSPGDRDSVHKRALELSSSRHRAAEPDVAVELEAEPVEEAVPTFEAGPEPVLEVETLEEAPEPPAEELPFPEPTYEDIGTAEMVLEEVVPPLVALVKEGAPGPEPSEETTDSNSAVLERLRQNLETARTSTDGRVLSDLASGSVEELQLALLENFDLPELAVMGMARRASATVASRIYRSRRWFSRPRIREALLDCPSAPAAAQLEALGSLRDFQTLLKVLASPRIRHLEVKAKGRSRLRALFQTLSQGEKLAAVHKGGKRLLQQLWTDFFRDEALVLRCLQEKRLDEGTVLEIARSKVAPRRALETIGNSSAWTASYPIRLALVLNPKTPRPVAMRLLLKLKPADRKMIRKNQAISPAIRRQA